jgi:hypothetical protein
MVAVIGCTSGDHLQVYVYSHPEDGGWVGQGPPIAGAVIAFRDPDGSSRSTTTDHDGHASGDVERGGSVWCSPSGPLVAQGTNALIAFDDVEPHATLVFGALPPAHATIATMAITATPPPPPPGAVTFAEIYTTCSRGPTMQGTVQLDDRCTDSVDILAVVVVSQLGDEQVEAYAFLPAQPIVDGGAIAVPSTAWRPLDTVTVHVANLDGATLGGGAIGNSFGFAQTASPTASGDAVTARLALVGPTLWVTFGLATSAGKQQVDVMVDASAPPIDARAVAAPYVAVDGIGTTAPTWSFDDHGGVLAANAMVTSFMWSDFNVSYQEGVTATVIGPPSPTGPLPALALPRAFGDVQPRSDLFVQEQIGLARIQTQMFDPFQAATLRVLPTMQVGDSTAFTVQ